MDKFYRTKYDYEPGGGRETTESPSKTIPGEARTINDILARYQQGQLPEGQKNAQYFDAPMEQIGKMFNPGNIDLTDLEKLSNNVNQMKEEVNTALENKRKAKEEEARKKAEEEKRKQIIEEYESQKSEE